MFGGNIDTIRDANDITIRYWAEYKDVDAYFNDNPKTLYVYDGFERKVADLEISKVSSGMVTASISEQTKDAYDLLEEDYFVSSEELTERKPWWVYKYKTKVSYKKSDNKISFLEEIIFENYLPVIYNNTEYLIPTKDIKIIDVILDSPTATQVRVEKIIFQDDTYPEIETQSTTFDELDYLAEKVIFYQRPPDPTILEVRGINLEEILFDERTEGGFPIYNSFGYSEGEDVSDEYPKKGELGRHYDVTFEFDNLDGFVTELKKQINKEIAKIKEAEKDRFNKLKRGQEEYPDIKEIEKLNKIINSVENKLNKADSINNVYLYGDWDNYTNRTVLQKSGNKWTGDVQLKLALDPYTYYYIVEVSVGNENYKVQVNDPDNLKVVGGVEKSTITVLGSQTVDEEPDQ